MTRIERLGSKDEVRSTVSALRRDGKSIGLVPTMGALHEGHLSLVRQACTRTDVVAVSIFVNPTQFGPGEDFERYPRQMEADLELLAAEGVEFVFAPTTDAMYGRDAQVSIDPGPLATRWEGAIRPGHFSGVATVVTKLLSIVRPDLAFFGEKDYQQLKVIEQVNMDLDLGVGIVGCETVREPDGLALSSRNVYLDPEQRDRALALQAALGVAAAEAVAGERDGARIEAAMRSCVERLGEGEVILDYAAVVDADTLEPLAHIDTRARAIIAARVGTTRLIDNRALVVESAV